MNETPAPQLDVERTQRLYQLSSRTGTPVDQLLQAAVDDLLQRSDIDITRLAESIAAKNAELYHRLAQ